ncbi:MAG: LPXTG cell wall anchor domain-containing protein, partial [Clostridia bacterium]|nr:LPXTG cell wall anchor domain-containing protein [Clostridia bacterium]
GTLYSGGVVNLDVELEVPVELDNQFKKLVGKLDWEFMIEEFPVEEDDPDAPQTGDRTNLVLYTVLSVGSLTAIIILILFMRKKKENPDRATN